MIRNNDTESHEAAVGNLEFLKTVASDPGCPADVKPLIQELVKKGVPPVGEDFVLMVPEQMVQQILTLRSWILGAMNELTQSGNYTEEELGEAMRNLNAPQVFAEVARWMQENYVRARDETQAGADDLKGWFRSQGERKEELK